MIYLQLFYQFFKTGLFAVGGGLATLPFLYEMANTTRWFSHADVADMIAISESTPGAIGINMSTYSGFLAGGVLGGVVATLGLACPSVIIIIIISRILPIRRMERRMRRVLDKEPVNDVVEFTHQNWLPECKVMPRPLPYQYHRKACWSVMSQQL